MATMWKQLTEEEPDFGKLFKFGMRHVIPSRAKKALAFNLVFLTLFLLVWYKFNGGFLPGFLRGKQEVALTTGSSPYQFFPLFNDGSKLKFAHAVNSKERLTKSLQNGDVMMLEADIILRGQGTPQQELVPIMAKPPATTSDITFREWLALAKSTGKGLKLDFKSIESVELSLQTLQEHHKEIKGPVWLNANILPGPGAAEDDKPVDEERFLRLCTTMFPQSTLSLGWKPATGPSENLQYTWKMVKQMYDLIQKWQIRQAVTFAVRASYVHTSIPQLKWLIEMTQGTLTLWLGPEDPITLTNLAFIRHRFEKNQVFYELNDELMNSFESIKSNPKAHISEEMRKGDTLYFSPDLWRPLQTGTDDIMHIGSESLIMRKSMLLSKQPYKAGPSEGVSIKGQVEFIGDTPGPVLLLSSGKDMGLYIYLRVSQYSTVSSLNGVECFIGANGKLHISGTGSDIVDEVVMSQKPGCVQFEINDVGDKITFHASVFENCLLESKSSTVLAEDSLQLTMNGVNTAGNHVALKAGNADIHMAIPKLHISQHKVHEV